MDKFAILLLFLITTACDSNAVRNSMTTNKSTPEVVYSTTTLRDVSDQEFMNVVFSEIHIGQNIEFAQEKLHDLGLICPPVPPSAAFYGSVILCVHPDKHLDGCIQRAELIYKDDVITDIKITVADLTKVKKKNGSCAR